MNTYDLVVPAQIDEEHLPLYAGLKGSTNATPVTIDGVEHAPTSLIFHGFAGGWNAEEKKYLGNYRFNRASEGAPALPAADWTVLPGITAVAEAPKEQPAKPAPAPKAANQAEDPKPAPAKDDAKPEEPNASPDPAAAPTK